METSSQNEKKVYDVNIAGVTVRLKSSYNEELVNELTGFLSEQIAKVQAANPSASFQNVLFLASLHIAEELLFSQKELKAQLMSMKSETLQLLTDLEQSPLNQTALDL